jgi:hypothetical protein
MGNTPLKDATRMRVTTCTIALTHIAAMMWCVSNFQSGVEPKGRKRHEYHDERQINASRTVTGAVMDTLSVHRRCPETLTTNPSINPKGIQATRYAKRLLLLLKIGCMAGA